MSSFYPNHPPLADELVATLKNRCRARLPNPPAAPRRAGSKRRSCRELLPASAARRFAWATPNANRSRLRQARHDAYLACLPVNPGKVLPPGPAT
ncbi:hypothetical protein [Accumulibacter sp.]|uniref:hypothetical protein n=1 Tax=Accumulibacter sp. TaxID=2053492 RepID=UPI0035B34487